MVGFGLVLREEHKLTFRFGLVLREEYRLSVKSGLDLKEKHSLIDCTRRDGRTHTDLVSYWGRNTK